MAIFGDYGEDNNGLLFEVDQNGAQELVRSIESTHQVHVRFTNTTSRPVMVWWRDFNGARCFYALLNPGQYFDVDTYVTHPWEFTDERTGERFYIGRNVIFRAPKLPGSPRIRVNCHISVGMRSLRDTALLRVAMTLPNVDAVRTLGLPKVVSEDLKRLVEMLQQKHPLHQRLA